MLEKLLDEIRSNGTMQPGKLAERLDTSVQMVQAMLAELERMGLLRQIDSACHDSCNGCQLGNMCATQGSQKQRLWMLAQKKT
jgi:hypothetical protein